MSSKMIVLSVALTCVLALANAQMTVPGTSTPSSNPLKAPGLDNRNNVSANKTDNGTQNNAQAPQGPGNPLLGTANILCEGLTDPKSCIGRLQCDQQLLAVCVAGICDCLGLTDARVPKELLSGLPVAGGLLGGRKKRGLLGNVGNTVDNLAGGLLGGGQQPPQGGPQPAQGGQQPAQGGLLGGVLGGGGGGLLG